MHELASVPVGAVAMRVELITLLGLIVGRDVSLLPHFMMSMSESTL